MRRRPKSTTPAHRHAEQQRYYRRCHGPLGGSTDLPAANDGTLPPVTGHQVGMGTDSGASAPSAVPYVPFSASRAARSLRATIWGHPNTGRALGASQRRSEARSHRGWRVPDSGPVWKKRDGVALVGTRVRSTAAPDPAARGRRRDSQVQLTQLSCAPRSRAVLRARSRSSGLMVNPYSSFTRINPFREPCPVAGRHPFGCVARTLLGAVHGRIRDREIVEVGREGAAPIVGDSLSCASASATMCSISVAAVPLGVISNAMQE